MNENIFICDNYSIPILFCECSRKYEVKNYFVYTIDELIDKIQYEHEYNELDIEKINLN